MAEYIIQDTTLTGLADETRALSGKTGTMTPNEMKDSLHNVRPQISVSSGGLITATVGNKSANQQLTTKSAMTITPTSTEQTVVSSGTYVTGDIKVAAASGTELPKLSNPATSDEIFLNKETIAEDGSIQKGTFTIDEELSDIDELLLELETTLKNKSRYNTIYIGSSVPADDFGVDGDFYIVRSNGV